MLFYVILIFCSKVLSRLLIICSTIDSSIFIYIYHQKYDIWCKCKLYRNIDNISDHYWYRLTGFENIYVWYDHGIARPLLKNITTFSLSIKHIYFISLLWVSILNWSFFCHFLLYFIIFTNLFSLFMPNRVLVQLSTLEKFNWDVF